MPGGLNRANKRRPRRRARASSVAYRRRKVPVRRAPNLNVKNQKLPVLALPASPPMAQPRLSAPVIFPSPPASPNMTLDGGLSGLAPPPGSGSGGLNALPDLPEVQELDLSVVPSEEHFNISDRTTPTRGLPTPPRGLSVPHLEALRHENGQGKSSISSQAHELEPDEFGNGSNASKLPPPPPGLEIPTRDVEAKTTPTHEPFPGLNPEAVPKLNLADLMKANVRLTSEEMYMLSRIDGSLSMSELEDIVIDASPLRQLALMKRLWRAGFLTF